MLIRGGHVLDPAQGLDAVRDVRLDVGRVVTVASDLFRRTMLGALEYHVLHEMRDAVGLGGLAAGTGLDPHAHGH